MRRFARMFLTAVTLATGVMAMTPREAHASGVVVGLRLGGPVYYPRPVYYGSYYYPYYYRPTVVMPAPVIVEQVPVVVQPAPVVVQPAPVVTQPAQPAPARQVVATSSPAANQDEVTRQYQLLSHADDKVRADAAMELGRLHADRAIDALAAVMTQDRSSQVRESAARALGLIGSQRSLPALRNAGLSDSDRDVRRSAQFSIEVIHSHLKGQ